MPVTDALTTRPCTAAEYRAMPEALRKTSLIDGLLIEENAPSEDHQRILANLFFALFGENQNSGKGIVRCAPYGVWLNEHTCLQPDLFFVSNERLHLIGGNACNGAPDLVVEILSPSTQHLDRVRKRELYAENGVKELWLVDPEMQEVIVYRFARSKEAPVRIVGPGDRLDCELWPGWSLTAAAVFQRDP